MTSQAVSPQLRAHDLLRLEPGAAIFLGEGRPGWIDQALDAAPWVVVRRAPARNSLVPVGVRGGTRERRWAAWISQRAVMACLPPEALVTRMVDLAPSRAALPALAALAPLADILAAHDLIWGPTGSVGFELASGAATVTQASDLDALIRCDHPLSRASAAEIVRATGGLSVRGDLLLETPAGGVSLLEYAQTEGRVAARGVYGPRLIDDPWALSLAELTPP